MSGAPIESTFGEIATRHLPPAACSVHDTHHPPALVLEDFSADDGWRQEILLSVEQSKAALTTLAKMHAFFWAGSKFWTAEGRSEAESKRKQMLDAVWPSGMYTQPDMQPKEQMTELTDNWAIHNGNFGERNS